MLFEVKITSPTISESCEKYLHTIGGLQKGIANILSNKGINMRDVEILLPKRYVDTSGESGIYVQFWVFANTEISKKIVTYLQKTTGPGKAFAQQVKEAYQLNDIVSKIKVFDLKLMNSSGFEDTDMLTANDSLQEINMHRMISQAEGNTHTHTHKIFFCFFLKINCEIAKTECYGNEMLRLERYK